MKVQERVNNTTSATIKNSVFYVHPAGKRQLMTLDMKLNDILKFSFLLILIWDYQKIALYKRFKNDVSKNNGMSL